uniref:Uncharacterized protein n=1 Tax=Tolypothrix bouteillei VB521301 TaxID=1479485 RepID=A0A0C1NMC3_9CYAN
MFVIAARTAISVTFLNQFSISLIVRDRPKNLLLQYSRTELLQERAQLCIYKLISVHLRLIIFF